VFKHGIGMTLGYPRSGTVLGLKVKVTGSISVFFTLCPEHNSKTKVFKLGMTLGYTKSGMVLG